MFALSSIVRENNKRNTFTGGLKKVEPWKSYK